jgi:serine protease AprX
VDGTSFAAPIVCSVIAQMLEANDRLSPAKIKEILTQTARKLPDYPSEPQGYGMVQASAAVEMAATTTL